MSWSLETSRISLDKHYIGRYLFGASLNSSGFRAGLLCKEWPKVFERSSSVFIACVRKDPTTKGFDSLEL